MVASSESTKQVDSTETDGEQPAAPSFSGVIEDLRASLAEFGEYTKYLIAVEVDHARLMAKKAAFYAVLGVIGLSVLVGFLAVGTGLLLVGIAGLIGLAFGNFWIGATIVGLLMFILPAAGVLFVWRYINSKAYRSLRLKYAERRQRQKRDFGRDIKEVAHA